MKEFSKELKIESLKAKKELEAILKNHTER